MFKIFLERFKNKLKFKTITINQFSSKYACKESTDLLKSKVLRIYFTSYARNTVPENSNRYIIK